MKLQDRKMHATTAQQLSYRSVDSLDSLLHWVSTPAGSSLHLLFVFAGSSFFFCSWLAGCFFLSPSSEGWLPVVFHLPRRIFWYARIFNGWYLLIQAAVW